MYSFRLISAELWNDPCCDEIIRSYAYFDNYAHSDDLRVRSTDIERMITIWNIFINPAVWKVRDWKANYDDTIKHLRPLVVCKFVFHL